MSTDSLTKLCQITDVPKGEMRCVSLTDRNLLVAHTTEGILVADEMCTHEDARLCDGNLNGTLVKCPLHGSRFELRTGQVLDDPATEDLSVYPVTIVENTVFVNLKQQK